MLLVLLIEISCGLQVAVLEKLLLANPTAGSGSKVTGLMSLKVYGSLCPENGQMTWS